MLLKTVSERLRSQYSVKAKVARSRSGLAAQIEEIKNKILSHYRTSIQQVRRERDRVRFYQQSLGWYEDSVTQLRSDMRRCENLAIAGADDLSSYVFSNDMLIAAERQRLPVSFSSFILNKFHDGRSTTMGNDLTYRASNNEARLHASFIMNEFPNTSAYDNYSKEPICEITPTFESLPQPVKPGESWGVFGQMSAWLLEAETIEMCLLTGMIGFGLLGAALSYVFFSTTVPEDVSKKGFSLAIIVVLRGATSAVATYLLLRGGVNLITDTGGNVSPYILFATCFAAAIYSEESWERIHSWFGKGPDEEDSPESRYFCRKIFSSIPAGKNRQKLRDRLCLRRPDSSASPRFDPTRGRNIGSRMT